MVLPFSFSPFHGGEKIPWADDVGQLGSPFVFHPAVGEIADQQHQMAKTPMPLRISGPQRHRSLQRCQRLVVFPHRPQNDAQVVMQFRPIGMEGDSLSQDGDGAIEFALVGQYAAEVVIRLGDLLVELNCPLEFRNRFVELLDVLINRTEISMVHGDLGICRDRLGEQIDGGIMLTHLRGQSPEQVQRIAKIGLLGENPAINGFGLAQPAGAVMRQARLQPLLKVHLHHLTHICR